MFGKRKKDFDQKKPVERQENAPLLNIKNKKPESNVPLPGESEVLHAKAYVDENQK